MAATKRMFILTDTKANNNKFWEISIDESGAVHSRNGRVGSKGQERHLGQGEALVKRKINEKIRKGYKEIEIVSGVEPSQTASATAVTTAAEEQIGRGDPVIVDLVRELAKINRHQIIAATGGQMDVDLSTGVVSTPLGVVTAENIRKARETLGYMERYVLASDFDAPAFRDHLEAYLMLVPQKVGAARGWHHSVIKDGDGLIQQNGLLDQLESSIDIALERIRDAKVKAGEAQPDVPKIFDVSMRINDDPALRAHIEAFYENGRQAMHASRNFKVKRIFDVSIGEMDKAFAEDGAKVGGLMELWHGTRAHNLLSILKSGLIIPKSRGSIHVTGRMFGDGIYGSDQSTKSLNYSYGYWDRGSCDNRCFMFLTDFAMGKSWHPDKTGSSVKPPAGFDSTYARGGQDLVRNNEMIVYRTSQVRLKYLVEFQQ